MGETSAQPQIARPCPARSRNLAEVKSERWRPPPFTSGHDRAERIVAAARRVIDLQAASIWRDLTEILPTLTGTVLDVGCGAQPYRGLLNPSVHYIALDTADAMAHFGYQTPDTVHFSGDRWPIDDGLADAVLSTETLEHVFEPRTFLAEAARVLRPAGKLILTVPFAARWHYVPHDYWRFTPSSLARLLEESGFADIAVCARGNEITVACQKAIALALPLLLPQAARGPAAWVRRVGGLATFPFMLALAALGNVSLRSDGGDDCLGYTVLAVRDGAGADAA